MHSIKRNLQSGSPPSTPRPSKVRVVQSSPPHAQTAGQGSTATVPGTSVTKDSRQDPKVIASLSTDIVTTLASLAEFNSAVLIVGASDTAAEEKLKSMKSREMETLVNYWNKAYMILRELASKVGYL